MKYENFSSIIVIILFGFAELGIEYAFKLKQQQQQQQAAMPQHFINIEFGDSLELLNKEDFISHRQKSAKEIKALQLREQQQKQGQASISIIAQQQFSNDELEKRLERMLNETRLKQKGQQRCVRWFELDFLFQGQQQNSLQKSFKETLTQSPQPFYKTNNLFSDLSKKYNVYTKIIKTAQDLLFLNEYGRSQKVVYCVDQSTLQVSQPLVKNNVFNEEAYSSLESPDAVPVYSDYNEKNKHFYKLVPDKGMKAQLKIISLGFNDANKISEVHFDDIKFTKVLIQPYYRTESTFLFLKLPSESASDLVLFGGQNDMQAFNDTWVLSDNQWHVPRVRGFPPLLAAHSSVLYTFKDKGKFCLLLFGGNYEGRDSNSLWVVEITQLYVQKYKFDFVQAEQTGEVPAPRQGHIAIVYKDFMYVFGGCGFNGHANVCYNDVYKMDLLSYPFEWQRITNEGESKTRITLPGPREGVGYVQFQHNVYITGGCQTNEICFRDTFLFQLDQDCKGFVFATPTMHNSNNNQNNATYQKNQQLTKTNQKMLLSAKCKFANQQINLLTGLCECEKGFTGPKCEQVCQCNGHGSCIGPDNHKACKCDEGFMGDNCEHAYCPDNCNAENNGGLCQKDTFSCLCNKGFKGTNCKSKEDCTLECSKSGNCQKRGFSWPWQRKEECLCFDGFIGEDCETNTSPNDCFLFSSAYTPIMLKGSSKLNFTYEITSNLFEFQQNKACFDSIFSPALNRSFLRGALAVTYDDAMLLPSLQSRLSNTQLFNSTSSIFVQFEEQPELTQLYQKSNTISEILGLPKDFYSVLNSNIASKDVNSDPSNLRKQFQTGSNNAIEDQFDLLSLNPEDKNKDAENKILMQIQNVKKQKYNLKEMQKIRKNIISYSKSLSKYKRQFIGALSFINSKNAMKVHLGAGKVTIDKGKIIIEFFSNIDSTDILTGIRQTNCSLSLKNCFGNGVCEERNDESGVVNSTCRCAPGFEGLMCEKQNQLFKMLQAQTSKNQTLNVEQQIKVLRSQNISQTTLQHIQEMKLSSSQIQSLVQSNLLNSSSSALDVQTLKQYVVISSAEQSKLASKTEYCHADADCTHVTMFSKPIQSGLCNKTSYQCQCFPMFTGHFCEEKIETCLNNCTSLEHGVCDDFSEACQCQNGYQGLDCSKMNLTKIKLNQDLIQSELKQREKSQQGDTEEHYIDNEFSDIYDGSIQQDESMQHFLSNSNNHPQHLKETQQIAGSTRGQEESSQADLQVEQSNLHYFGEPIYQTNATCPNNCSSQGFCIQGLCYCDAGKAGLDCALTSTFGCPGDGKCSLNGKCHNGDCQCAYGFYGVMCEFSICDITTHDLQCSGQGLCVKGECVCNDKYEGNLCQKFKN